ncbi:hypothetical protein BC831DRAFT_449946, partial [Entophlyctis helioformis]
MHIKLRTEWHLINDCASNTEPHLERLAVGCARCSLLPYGCQAVGGECLDARSLSTRSLSVSAM